MENGESVGFTIYFARGEISSLGSATAAGLVGYWRFNNDVAEFRRNSDTCLSDEIAQPHSAVGENYNSSNGSIIIDYSGLGNNGTAWGDLRYNSSAGKFGGALDFDGVNDYVDAGDDLS